MPLLHARLKGTAIVRREPRPCATCPPLLGPAPKSPRGKAGDPAATQLGTSRPIRHSSHRALAAHRTQDNIAHTENRTRAATPISRKHRRQRGIGAKGIHGEVRPHEAPHRGERLQWMPTPVATLRGRSRHQLLELQRFSRKEKEAGKNESNSHT